MSARIALGLLVVAASACSRGTGTVATTELARAESGDLRVVLLSEDAALDHDEDTFALEFRSATDDSLVDVGQVQASATMPMPGSSPMFGDIAIEPTLVPGRYRGTSDLGMAGTWRLTVEWDGPHGSGSATFSPMVQ